MISDSVVAKLLPNLTITEPRLSISFDVRPVIFCSLAKDSAACSAERLVATVNFCIVSVNFTISSAAIPN